MLWKLLLLLFPGIGEDDDGDQDADDGDQDADDGDQDADDGDQDADDGDQDADAEPPSKPISRAQKEIISLRERAQKAEDDHKRAMAELAEARKPQAAPMKDEVWEQEEAVLRNPDATDWQKYAVTSSRNSRMAANQAQQALMHAQDISDKAEFDRISITKPKVYADYKEKVEEARQQAIRNGNLPPPRSKVLAFLLGQDMLNDKVSSATQKKPKGAKRQTPPGARSDVSAKSSRLSTAEAVAKRLEGKRI
jgi:hypothetical protein